MRVRKLRGWSGSIDLGFGNGNDISVDVGTDPNYPNYPNYPGGTMPMPPHSGAASLLTPTNLLLIGFGLAAALLLRGRK